ncbi:thiol-disulfide oxidoreductase DCC family protein [Paenibacillus tarimensis]|uniref:thiol-disulfide oxidoreductase DCC family protein n=1 Tax=Paenibacillus tarimensis TaxID=416012 RepID=UPI001F35D43C|nr:DUF393 domain-containing protein [Paenibacillus tarimensis]MCF2943994.1 DUF393 domain-containing protein [Paenibacillus tarimensis]
MGTTGVSKETLYVLFDNTCMLCKQTVARLKQLHSAAELVYVPLQLLDEPDAPEVPGAASLNREALLEKLHVVDMSGRIYAGADGIVRIMRTLRGLRRLAWLYRLPGMRLLADAVYRYVAKRRYDWFGRADEGCAGGACSLPRRDDIQDGKGMRE